MIRSYRAQGVRLAERQAHTPDVDGAGVAAAIDVALAGGVGGGEVGTDEGLQHAVALKSGHAAIMRVPHIPVAAWVVHPPVVPAQQQPTP